MGSDLDNEVGYRRPPKRTQFKKGQSGNPKGRPKQRSSFAADLDKILREKVTLNENGREISITKRKAIIKSLTDAAIKKDIRAVSALLACIKLFGVGEEERSSVPKNFEPADLAILESYFSRQRKSYERSQQANKTKAR